MGTLLAVLHVLTAVFLIGPMAMLPMTAMRAVRAGNAPMVATLGTSTRIFSLASLLVAVFGFGVLGVEGKEHGISVTTSWILSSLILYVVALALNLALVVPALRRAAEELTERAPEHKNPQYGRIAAGSGIVTLLLLAVVVLMVWKP